MLLAELNLAYPLPFLRRKIRCPYRYWPFGTARDQALLAEHLEEEEYYWGLYFEWAFVRQWRAWLGRRRQEVETQTDEEGEGELRRGEEEEELRRREEEEELRRQEVENEEVEEAQTDEEGEEELRRREEEERRERRRQRQIRQQLEDLGWVSD